MKIGRKKEVASIHVQAKLTPSEFEVFRKLIESTGIKKSTLIRKVLLANANSINANLIVEKNDKDTKRLIFLANKSSNNLNQIARKVNQTHRSGIVERGLYLKTLSSLESIQTLMKEAIRSVSQG